jgi:DNA polymerase-3 subunit delta'
MQIDTYLKEYQPIIYKTFVNALTTNKLSHAYLLSGSTGMPLKDTAIYLAKSLLCDHPNPLACNECITCIRVDEGNYPDLMVFGDGNTKIKKGDIEKITSNFDKTALEEKGIMIYVLHLIETMTPVAVNSLLKFLEEPGKNIFAFLTTENEAKILPTIISRTQVLRFREIDREKVIKDAENMGVLPENAEILSAFYNDSKTIKEISESKDFEIAKQCLNDQLNSLIISPEDAVFASQRFVVPALKQQPAARLYIKMLTEIFKELLNLSVNESITLKSYDNILHELLKHVEHIDKSLIVLMSAPKKLDYNVNIGLLLDHIIYSITREGK